MANIKKLEDAKQKPEDAKDEQKSCFVIMPISDTDGYPQGHFHHVYQNIIVPSCKMAGYQPVRADQVKATNMIHLDILKRLIDAPISICDLSSRNPNVLFELGIRQAFDKPVVLIQEIGTPKIFDISPLRYTEYSRDMKYHDVLAVQQEIKEAVLETVEANGKEGNINSIVRLMALAGAANIPDVSSGKGELAYNILQSEISDIKKTIEMIAKNQKTELVGSLRNLSNVINSSSEKNPPIEKEIDKYKDMAKIILSSNENADIKIEKLREVINELDSLSKSASSELSKIVIRSMRRDILSFIQNLQLS